MKITKRLVASLLVLTMILPALSFAEAAFDKKVDITWLGYYTSDITVAEDSDVERYLEEQFNVNITPVSDVSKTGFDLYASGLGLLDATFYTVYLDNANNIAYMYDQEMIRAIPEEWLQTYYPTGMKYLNDFLGEDYFAKGNHLTNGLLLNLPFTRTENNSQSMIVYRKDWLDKLNLKEPTTLEEFHDMLYAFTYNDPDGNGVKDTYGLDAATSWLGLWMVYGANGIAQSQGGKCGTFNLQDDGTVTYTSVTEAYKQSLKTIAQWYQEGILDPECITDARADIRTKWANGSVGAMVDSFTWCLSKRGPSSIVNMVEDVYGEGSVGVLGALTCKEGDGKVYGSINYPTTNVNQSIVFTASATDEQVIRVLQILEGCAANDEIYARIAFGEENVDYVMDGTQLKINSDVSIEYQAAKGLGETFYGLSMTSPEMTYITYSDRDRANLATVEQSPVVYRDRNFTNVTGDAYKMYFEEVKKVEGEFYTDILLGRKTIENDWDEYVSKMNKAGLEEILAEYATLLAK